MICCHDGQYVYTAFAENMQEEFKPREKRAGGRIDLLCENIGRENFGTGLENQRKGILGGVKINDHRHFGYEIFPLPLDEEQLEKIDFSGEYSAGVPGFYQFEFEVQKPGDTFLDTAGFGKGCAFINGFNLGRFWEIGPQRRLYIPAPLLREGRNTLILFETEGKAGDHIVPIQVHHIFLKSRRSESISVWYVRHPAKLCWQLSRCRVSYKYKKVYHPAEASQNQTILLYSPYFSLSSDNA